MTHEDPLDPQQRFMNALQGTSRSLGEPVKESRYRDRQRNLSRKAGRSWGPDTLPGLLDYFINACPPMDWAGQLAVGNLAVGRQMFAELRRDLGLTPDECRTMVDLYVASLKGRAPQTAYIYDFKWRRFQMLDEMRAKGLAVGAEERASAWQSPGTSTGPSTVKSGPPATPSEDSLSPAEQRLYEARLARRAARKAAHT